MPWSGIPLLKNIFDREVPAAGNTQTADTSRFFFRQMQDEVKFKSKYTANYKMVISHADKVEDSVNLWSIDTGNGGNIF